MLLMIFLLRHVLVQWLKKWKYFTAVIPAGSSALECRQRMLVGFSWLMTSGTLKWFWPVAGFATSVGMMYLLVNSFSVNLFLFNHFFQLTLPKGWQLSLFGCQDGNLVRKYVFCWVATGRNAESVLSRVCMRSTWARKYNIRINHNVCRPKTLSANFYIVPYIG